MILSKNMHFYIGKSNIQVHLFLEDTIVYYGTHIFLLNWQQKLGDITWHEHG